MSTGMRRPTSARRHKTSGEAGRCDQPGLRERGKQSEHGGTPWLGASVKASGARPRRPGCTARSHQQKARIPIMKQSFSVSPPATAPSVLAPSAALSDATVWDSSAKSGCCRDYRQQPRGATPHMPCQRTWRKVRDGYRVRRGISTRRVTLRTSMCSSHPNGTEVLLQLRKAFVNVTP